MTQTMFVIFVFSYESKLTVLLYEKKNEFKYRFV